MTKKEGLTLATTASIAASAKELSTLSADNWTEERHLEAIAMLAKIQANASALQAMVDAYQPVITKLGKANNIDVTGVATLKIPNIEGDLREVSFSVHVGETVNPQTSLIKEAIHAATDYKVEDDPQDACVKRIRVAAPEYWDLYNAPVAAINNNACIAAVNNGKLDPSCRTTKQIKKFGVEYKINDTDAHKEV